MASELHPLEEVVEEIIDRRGVTPFKLGGDFVSSGHRVISAKLVKNGRVDLRADEPRYVDATIYKKWMKSPLRRDDVIMTSEAPLGELAYLDQPRDWVLGQRLFAIRPRKNVLSGKFLYYVLATQSVRDAIIARASGTTVQGIRQAELRKVEIPVPPLDVQLAAAEVLGLLDDRIDNLRQANATLDAIAQALFKSWFVDFDAVRAKAEGREPEGMGAATAALFPSKFQDSELGPIPKGWRVTKIGEVVNVVKGRSYKSSELQDSDTALVTLKSFNRGGGFRRDGFKPYVGPYKEEQVLTEGDCIVAFTDVTQQAELIGRSAIVTGTEDHSRLVASLDVGILRPRTRVLTPGFLRSLLSGDRYVSHIKGFVTGTTVLHLAKDGLPSYPFVMPPDALIVCWAEIGKACSDRQALNVRKIDLLAELRDTLLPRLISGKLRLPTTESAVDELIEEAIA